jgi:hypothetical protein
VATLVTGGAQTGQLQAKVYLLRVEPSPVGAETLQGGLDHVADLVE